MGFIKEFKEFALKGSVLDLAIGVIIGAAFGKIVTSLVQDIIMPPIGLLVGRIDFKDLKLILKSAGTDGVGKLIPAVSINYGNFINILIEFLIIAFCIFLMVRAINQLKATPVEVIIVAEPNREEALLTEIRDLLKSR